MKVKKPGEMRFLSFILSLTLLIGLMPTAVFAEDTIKTGDVGTGGTGVRSLTDAYGNVFLGNQYIEIGIAPAGSFGTTVAAPTSGAKYFHPDNSQGYRLGLRSDGDGWDTGAAPTTRDFFLPGTVDEGFMIGWSATSGETPILRSKASQIGEGGIANFTGYSVTDKSSASKLMAESVGVASNTLQYTQNVSFGAEDKLFTTTITLQNTSAAPIYNANYIRKFDPDQSLTQGHITDNYFFKDVTGGVWVVASSAPLGVPSPVTPENHKAALDKVQNPFVFYTDDPRAQAISCRVGTNTFADIYNRGSDLYGTHFNSDTGIGLEFKFPVINPGQSVTFTYQSSLDPNFKDVQQAIENLAVMITKQPVSRTYAEGKIDGKLVVQGEMLIDGVSAGSDALVYQWYSNTINSTEGGTPIPDATQRSFEIPKSLSANTTTFYYCIISATVSGISKSAASGVAMIRIVPPGSTIYSVKFNENSTNIVSNMPSMQTLSSGEKIAQPADPSISGMEFTGWYTASTGGTKWDFITPVTANTTLYAQWQLPDTTNPVISSISGNPTTWTNTDQLITFTVTDDRSLATVTVSKDGGTAQILTGVTSNYSFSTDGNGVYVITAIDTKGNTSTQTVNVTKIDKIIPVISDVDGNPSNWTNKDVTLTVIANDVLSGLASYAYSFDNGATWQSSNSKVFTSNQNVQVKVKDAAGNISAASTVNIIKIDKVVPTGTITIKDNSFKTFINTITFGLFFKNTAEVTITAQDSGDETVAVAYTLSETELTDFEGVSWTAYTGKITLMSNRKVIVYAKLTDAAGNQSIVNSDGIVIYTDSSRSTESITFIKTAQTDVRANVVLNGNTVREIKNGSNVISSSDYTVDTAGEITFKASYLDSLSAGDYTLTVSYNPMGEVYAERDGNAAPAATVITLTVQKADNSVTNISGISKIYDGNTVSKPTYHSLSTGTETIEYKAAGADDSTYSTAAPKNAGDYTVRVSVAADANYKAASGAENFAIARKQVTISGVSIETTKEYNGKTDVRITNNGTLSANYDSSNLTIKAGTAAYNDKTAANGKPVTFSGFELVGSAKDNYELIEQPASTTANITAKELTVTLAVKDKQYDDKNDAEFDGAPSIVGIVDGDTVDLTNGTPSFASKAVANNIVILFTAFSVSGADAANYALTQPTGITASIKPYFAAKDVQYSVNSGDWLKTDFVITAKDGFKVSKTNTVTGPWIYTLSASDETDNGKFDFYVMDTETGVISEKITENYKIDKTAPTGTISIGGNSWNTFLNTITFGLFFNATQTVSIDADNDLSGIAKVEYAASSSQLSLDEVKALTWQAGRNVNVTVEDTKQFIYYAKITDNAGNISYLSTDGAEYDTTAPDITGITSGETYYTTQIAAATDKNLKSVTLNGEAKTSPVRLDGNTDATYTVVVTDKAGNSTTRTVTMKTIASLSNPIDSITENNVKSSDKIVIETVKSNVGAVGTANATEAEKAALKGITDRCNSLLEKIADTAAETRRIMDAVSGYDLLTVKSSDKAALEQLIQDMDTLVATENLTADEAAALDAVKSAANGLLAKISDTAAEIRRITDAVNGYDLVTVKSPDEAALEQLIEDINTLVATENLTADEAAALGVVKTTANGLLAKISDTAAEIRRITDAVNGYDLAAVKSTDKEVLEQLIQDIDSIVATESLTSDEAAALGAVKTTVNGLLSKISDTDAETKHITDAVNDYDLATVKSSDKAALEQFIRDIDTIVSSDNMTEDEITALNGIKTKAENLLAKISGTAALIKKLTDRIDGYKLGEVKSTDKASIEQVITDAETLIATENLTEDEKAALETVKTKANTLLARIADASESSTKKEIKDSENINKDNVKLSDKDTLIKARAALETAIRDYEGNYTETELTALKDQLATVIAALPAIDISEKVVNSIIALPEPSKVKASDKDAINAAKAAYDALTDFEKTMVDSEYVMKLDADLKALADLDKVKVPQTGDNSNMLLWIALLFISGGVLTAVGVKTRKRKAVR